MAGVALASACSSSSGSSSTSAAGPASASGAASSTGTAPLQHILVITDLLTTVYTPLYTADKLGFFEKHGLNVSIGTLQSGVTITGVMQSGSVDFAASDSITEALGVKQGAQFTAIASEGNASPEVCARPAWAKQHGLTSSSTPAAVFSGFKGSKFAVTGVGGTPDLLGEYLVSAHGKLNPASDMQTVSLGSPAGVATGFKQGAVDVTFVEAEQYAHANPTAVVNNVLRGYFPTTSVATLTTALNRVILPQMPADGTMTKAGWDKVQQVLTPVNPKPLDTTEGGFCTNQYLQS